MIYIDDCITATIQYLKAPRENLKRCIYNLGGISFTPEEFIAEVQKLIPGLTIEYDPDPVKSKIADSWPKKLDDTQAKKDWGLNYNVNMYDLAYKILDNIDEKYKQNKIINLDSSLLSKDTANYRQF